MTLDTLSLSLNLLIARNNQYTEDVPDRLFHLRLATVAPLEALIKMDLKAITLVLSAAPGRPFVALEPWCVLQIPLIATAEITSGNSVWSLAKVLLNIVSKSSNAHQKSKILKILRLWLMI